MHLLLSFFSSCNVQRVNFLEALEAAFESSNDMAFSDDFFPDIWNYDE